MQTISIHEMPVDAKLMLLKELDYGSDGEYVLDKAGEYVLDKYLEIPIRLDNMMILPGSTIILDNNELSLSAYMEEYGDVFA